MINSSRSVSFQLHCICLGAVLEKASEGVEVLNDITRADYCGKFSQGFERVVQNLGISTLKSEGSYLLLNRINV